MSVELLYRVPVLVKVEGDEVERVTVEGEAVEYAGPSWEDASPAERAAREVAESADWPAWEFGY